MINRVCCASSKVGNHIAQAMVHSLILAVDPCFAPRPAFTPEPSRVLPATISQGTKQSTLVSPSHVPIIMSPLQSGAEQQPAAVPASGPSTGHLSPSPAVSRSAPLVPRVGSRSVKVETLPHEMQLPANATITPKTLQNMQPEFVPFAVPSLVSAPLRKAPLQFVVESESSESGVVDPFAFSGGSTEGRNTPDKPSPPVHALQPVFVNGQRKMTVLHERDTVSDDEDEEAAADLDRLVDFLDEPDTVKVPETRRVNSKPKSALSMAELSTPSLTAAFGNEARDYLTVLMQVFERARLTASQQVCESGDVGAGSLWRVAWVSGCLACVCVDGHSLLARFVFMESRSSTPCVFTLCAADAVALAARCYRDRVVRVQLGIAWCALRCCGGGIRGGRARRGVRE